MDRHQPPTRYYSAKRDLYRDSDFAPVDFMASSQCCCEVQGLPSDHCVIHNETAANSSLKPAVVMRYSIVCKGVPSTTPPAELNEIFKKRMLEQQRVARIGTHEINYATQNLEEFNNCFKISDQHKERQRLYDKKIKTNAARFKQEPSIEKVPEEEEMSLEKEKQKASFWKRMWNRLPFSGSGQIDEGKTKRFSFPWRKQSVSPAEDEVALDSSKSFHQEHKNLNKTDSSLTQDTVSVTTENTAGSSKSHCDQDERSSLPSQGPPSVEELQARSASFKYDAFNSARAPNGGWVYMSREMESWPSYRSLKNRYNAGRRDSLASSKSQPTPQQRH